jgi:PAS domain S-box-containing protein
MVEATLQSDLLDLFFSQSLDGFFFMMIDQPIHWNDSVDKNRVLDYVFDHQRITKINDAMLRQYGASRQEFLGRTPADLFAHDIAHGRDLWRRMFDAGRLHVESDERNLDGRPITIEGDYICFADSHGRITGHFGIQRDITERKHSEEALRRYNQRLMLLQQANYLILSARSVEEIAGAAMGRFHQLVACNRAWLVVFDGPGGTARLAGVYDAAMPLGSLATCELPLHLFCNLSDLRRGKVHIIDNAAIVPSVEGRTRLEDEGICSFVIVPLIAEGNLIGALNFGSEQPNAFSVDQIEIAKELANSLAVAIRQAHLNRQIESHAAQLEQRVTERTEQLSRANASLLERIAERERAEHIRRESEERLAAILQTAMDAILVIDSRQKILIFNEAAEKVFNCSSAEATGQDICKFLTDDFSSVLNSYIATVNRRAAKQFWIPDGLHALRADGERFPVEATMSRVELGGEKLFTIILRDINERKQAEAKLDQLERTNLYLQQELQTELNFENIIGASPVMQKVFNSIEMVADTDSTVLLLGATGTGKELIAHALHNRSRRRGNAIIKLNCAALPASLVESELFGHERGAFTGAVALKKGRFELADGGTIFLDEVGELSLDTQTKLLRVLQEQEFERVGGSRTLKVDVRVIAATNRDLSEEVFRGAFRADLFYRLNVFPIEVPPLHKRKEDIPFWLHILR